MVGGTCDHGRTAQTECDRDREADPSSALDVHRFYPAPGFVVLPAHTGCGFNETIRYRLAPGFKRTVGDGGGAPGLECTPCRVPGARLVVDLGPTAEAPRRPRQPLSCWQQRISLETAAPANRMTGVFQGTS